VPMALPLPVRGNKTALPREVPWPYESFGRRRPQLRRLASRRGIVHVPGLSCGCSDCEDSHLVGALE